MTHCRAAAVTGRSVPLQTMFLLSTLGLNLSCVQAQPVTENTPPGKGNDRHSLAALITADWPRAGSVHARYSDELGNDLEVGWEFDSHAWYRVWQRQVISGVTPEGEGFSGEAKPNGITARSLPRGAEWLLDTVFPEVALVAVLEDESVPVVIERTPEGGWRVTVSLPRGSRMPREYLSSVEIDRWGGADKMSRDVVFVVRPDRTVEDCTAPSRPSPGDPRPKTLQFDVASASPAGFQVVEHHPPPGQMRLVECRFTLGASGAFEADRVLELALSRRMASPVVTPLVTAEQAEADPTPPVPIRATPAVNLLTRNGLIGGGVLLLALGLLAWWKARRS